jgi:hypothetical protein
MRFLYRRRPPHLETTPAGWQIHRAPRTRIESAPAPTPSLLRSDTGVFPMLDILLIALGIGLFALTVGYAYACERL